jgi:hypothetical protein
MEMHQLHKFRILSRTVGLIPTQAASILSALQQQLGVETDEKRVVGFDVFAENDPYRTRIHETQFDRVSRHFSCLSALKKIRDSLGYEQLDTLGIAIDD